MFGRKKSPPPQLKVDLHSHLIPGIDDGVKSIEESIEIIRRFSQMGYRKLITTPHINREYYPNNPDIINSGLELVREKIEEENIPIVIEAAAEYYLDMHFLEKVEANKKVMSFNGKYVLFETSFFSEPLFLNEAIFALQSAGYQPVLAHPERYAFVHQNPDVLFEVKEKGALLQMNINSLTGHYGPEVKKVAERIISRKMVSFLGSDCHHSKHIGLLERARETKYYRKAFDNELLNNALIGES